MARGVRRQLPRTVRTLRPKRITKTSSRKVGQRFPPQAKQQRQKTSKLKRRISRVNQLSRTRSVDIRKVSGSGFKIFAPRNTAPALTVGGKRFVENPDTRPTNLNQLQIRQGQVKQIRRGITPRQIIDRNVDRATNFAFNVGTELFQGGDSIRGQIFDAGVSTREGIKEKRAKNRADAKAGIPAKQSEKRREQFDLFKLQTGQRLKTVGTGTFVFGTRFI